MLKNLDELITKMCICENDGVGVEVDGLFYFYEDFDNDGANISRVYRHFGTDKEITFYSMTWAHQKRIKGFMDLYAQMVEYSEKERACALAKVIAKYIAQWSGCTTEKAIEQVETLNVSYAAIA